ncbi:DNA mismatch repair protein PMS1 isoform X2 [Aristolochia californica]
MEGKVDSPSIKLINKGVAHRICSGQVILDLSSAIKELVENSLDAGATSIEITLKEHGEESFKVTDNGFGISPNNFQVLALKHHTSKITNFSDLQSLATYGFRGEALSSLCALGNLSIETRTKNEPTGTHLTFSHSGSVTSERKIARQVGTTVTVEKLFSTLPVRSKEFNRNIRREYGKLISLLNAYAIIAKGVRLLCTNSTGKNVRTVVLKTQGNGSIKDNIITVFGMNTFACLEPLNISISECCGVEGFLSRSGNGSGRNSGDRQFFYVNGRPVDMPKVSKLLNELYKNANSRQYPMAIMNFVVPSTSYDVNVTPDKRKIFFSDEGSITHSLREAIGNIYSPSQCSFSVNQFEGPTKTKLNISEADTPCEDEEPHVSSKVLKPEESGQKDQGNVQEFSLLERMQSKDVVSLSDGKDVCFQSAFGIEKVRTSENHALRTPLPSKPLSHSSMVQSSLSKFISVNKRKHERAGLSELPVLRNEMLPCQVRKVSSTTNATDSRALLCHSLGDNDTEDKEDQFLDKSGDVNLPSDIETPVASSDVDDTVTKEEISGKHVTEDQEIGFHNDVDKTSSDLNGNNALVQSSDLILDTPVPCTDSEKCYILHFSINDLKTRRKERWSRLCSSSSLREQVKLRRCYTAATLEASQIENEEGKARALAAATKELERFFKKEDFGRMKVIGQFNLGFIIGKLDKDLFIVDQHAADEKYNFERLSQSTILNQQPLLQPIRLELSPEEEVVASIHMDVIRKNGFTLIEDADAPPGHHYLLKTVPFSKNITFGVADVKELISTLADSQGECSIMSSYKMDDPSSLCPSRVRGMLASRACKASVVIGDPLGRNEMEKILKNLVGLKSPWNCPHGRPTMRHLVDLSIVSNW